MEVFVKDFATYRTTKKATLVHSSLVADSLDNESSSITVNGLNINRDDVGNWLLADGVIYQIATVTPEKDHADLTLRQPLDAFSRLIELQTQPSDQTIGGFIENTLKHHWVDEADLMYAVPYLIVSNLDTTGFVVPEVDGSGCFNLPNYCRTMRKKYRVSIRFSDAGSNLLCKISKSPIVSRNISFADGRSILKSVSYGSSGYAKLTVLHDIDTKEKDSDGNAVYIRETTTWYRSEDDSISQLIPSRRASGEWGVLHLMNCPNVEEKVVDEFSKNWSGHKLEFWSTLNIDVNTNCTFIVHGKTLKSYISCKRKNSANDRFYYKAGELATTVTEKLKGVL